MWLFCELIAPISHPARLNPHRWCPVLSHVPSALSMEPRSLHSVQSHSSAVHGAVRGGEIDVRIELDLSLRRTGEGGLALDASSRPFVMVVFGPRRQVLVIPAATIERVAATLQTHGKVARGYFGLGLQPTRLDGDDGIGIMVMSVDPNGPGATAGVRQGDVIIKWNDQQIQGVRVLLRALGPDTVGSTVKLALRRGGELAETRLTVRERPET